MGAWSHDLFGNDDANDWAYNLESVHDLSVIEAALDRVLDADEYLEAPEASEAVAAIEVLAKLLGKGTQTDSYTEKMDEWVNSVPVQPDAPLITKASRAIERIRGDSSELRELWDESGDAEWLGSLDALQRAITQHRA